MSTERILVHSSIASEFAQEFKTATNNMFGAPNPSPVLVASAAVKKNRKLISEAVAKGAKVLTGDPDSQEDSEFRLRPIVIENVKKDMDIFYEESFGPTVSIITVESEEEAIAIANDTDYGLSAAVFTEDLKRAFRVAKQIESG